MARIARMYFVKPACTSLLGSENSYRDWKRVKFNLIFLVRDLALFA